MVIAFHLYPNRLSGGFIGVDIFFVISGFLITSHSSRDIYAGTFSITSFWARRIRRLLPAAFLVLAVTLIAIQLLSNLSDKATWFYQVLSSTFYFQNWQLARSAVDYLAQQTTPSPVQHFWSLSVEEQFYIFWPLLLSTFALSLRPNRVSARSLMLFILGIIFIGSLLYSIYLSSHNPSVAYFSTFTRMWEFASGALLALVHSELFPKVGSRTRELVAGLSIGVLSITALLFSEAIPFPSWTALIVVMPTCTFIWASCNHGVLGRVWRIIPIQRVGDASYSAYLWHWPLIIFVPLATGHSLRTSEKILIVVATLLLALATRKYVELPFIRTSIERSPAQTSVAKRRTYVNAGLVAVLLSVISLSSSSHTSEMVDVKLQASQRASGHGSNRCFGAYARLADGSLCSNPAFGRAIYPDPAVAERDNSSVDYPDCRNNDLNDGSLKLCKIGNPVGNFKVLLVGDSHAAQFRGPMGALAQAHGWQLRTLTKGACALNYSQRVADSSQQNACRMWVNRVVAHIMKEKYDLIVTSAGSGFPYMSDSDASLTKPVGGLIAIWRKVLSSGSRILVIKDTPRPMNQVNTCVLAHLESPNEHCSVPRKSALLSSALDPAVKQMNNPKVRLLNLDNVYCNRHTCEAVIGNVLVYRDSNYTTNSYHVTNTFANTLNKQFSKAIYQVMK